MADGDWTRLGGISRDTLVATGANVEAYVASQIGAAYKAKGSLAFASLPAPGKDYEGFVYNVTDAFTTTASFVEGAGKAYPAGTNVVCVNTSGTTYKWDVLAGVVDLSGYATKTELSSHTGDTTAHLTSAEHTKLSYLAGNALTNIQSDTLNVSSVMFAEGGAAFTINVKLTDSTADTDSTVAASAAAVKAAYDRGSAGVTAAAAERTARTTTLKNAVAALVGTKTKSDIDGSMDTLDDVIGMVADILVALRSFANE